MNQKDLDEKRKRAEQSNRAPVMKEHQHPYWNKKYPPVEDHKHNKGYILPEDEY